MGKVSDDYDAWAPYYDLVHQGLAGEAEFYVLEAARTDGPVLELGCGTGRIAIAMAMTGVDVVGLDISPGMLAVCEEKLAEVGPVKGSLTLVQGDMRTFALDAGFSLIIMPYRSFMHLVEPADQEACLRRVHAHLKPGGRFVMNQWAAKPSAVMRAIQEAPRGGMMPVDCYDAGEGYRVEHFHGACYDEFNQLIEEEHLLRERDSDDTVVHEERLRMVRTWATPREMRRLVTLCGFEIEYLFGGFGGEPFVPESTEMVWVLKRPA